MNCDETRDLIHGYFDGELELVKSIEIEDHLNDCHPCAQSAKQIRSLRSTLSQDNVRFDLPKSLEQRVRSTLSSNIEPKRRPGPLFWRWFVVGASAMVALALVWVIAGVFSRQSSSDVIAQEIVSSHVRSLMADHLTDVPSSDQHTVKPWFNGKLDFSPPVKDLSQQGFSLTGGRLDYIGSRPVAALVYQRRQHSINLFVWPSTDSAADSERASVHQGYNLIAWTNGGMAYWVVSDLNLAELQQFVQLLREQTPEGPAKM